MQSILQSASIALLACFFAHAQQPGGESPFAPLRLPEGNDAWVVQISTNGGFTGAGEGNWAISSAGSLVCSAGTRCPTTFTVADFQPLVDMFRVALLPAPTPLVTSFCRDCITRTMSIRYRDAMGMTRIFTTSWDDTTRDKVPPQVIRIYEAVVALLVP